MSCSSCSLRGRSKVPTERAEGSRVLFIGDVPRADEAREGRPFIGFLGQKVRALLPMINEATVTNTVLCIPPNNKITDSMIRHCNAHIRKLVTEHDEIYMLGASALKSVFGREKEFKLVNGNSWQAGDKRYCCLYHPAAMLHKPDLRYNIEKMYCEATENFYKRTDKTVLTPLEPRYAEYPDGFIASAGDFLVVDTEWDEHGRVLIGVNVGREGVWQHVRRYA